MDKEIYHDDPLLKKYGFYNNVVPHVVMFFIPSHQNPAWVQQVDDEVERIYTVQRHYAMSFDALNATNPDVTATFKKVFVSGDPSFNQDPVIVHQINYKDVPIVDHYMYATQPIKGYAYKHEISVLPLAARSPQWDTVFMPDFASDDRWKEERTAFLNDLHQLERGLLKKAFNTYVSKYKKTMALHKDTAAETDSDYKWAKRGVDFYTRQLTQLKKEAGSYELGGDSYLRTIFENAHFANRTPSYQRAEKAYQAHIDGIIKLCRKHESLFTAYSQKTPKP